MKKILLTILSVFIIFSFCITDVFASNYPNDVEAAADNGVLRIQSDDDDFLNAIIDYSNYIRNNSLKKSVISLVSTSESERFDYDSNIEIDYNRSKNYIEVKIGELPLKFSLYDKLIINLDGYNDYSGSAEVVLPALENKLYFREINFENGKANLYKPLENALMDNLSNRIIGSTCNYGLFYGNSYNDYYVNLDEAIPWRSNEVKIASTISDYTIDTIPNDSRSNDLNIKCNDIGKITFTYKTSILEFESKYFLINLFTSENNQPGKFIRTIYNESEDLNYYILFDDEFYNNEISNGNYTFSISYMNGNTFTDYTVGAIIRLDDYYYLPLNFINLPSESFKLTFEYGNNNKCSSVISVLNRSDYENIPKLPYSPYFVKTINVNGEDKEFTFGFGDDWNGSLTIEGHEDGFWGSSLDADGHADILFPIAIGSYDTQEKFGDVSGVPAQLIYDLIDPNSITYTSYVPNAEFEEVFEHRFENIERDSYASLLVNNNGIAASGYVTCEFKLKSNDTDIIVDDETIKICCLAIFTPYNCDDITIDCSKKKKGETDGEYVSRILSSNTELLNDYPDTKMHTFLSITLPDNIVIDGDVTVGLKNFDSIAIIGNGCKINGRLTNEVYGLILSDINFEAQSNDQIAINPLSDCAVHDCTFDGYYIGINSKEDAYVSDLNNNTFRNCEYGIYSTTSNESSIISTGSIYADIQENKFVNCKTAIKYTDLPANYNTLSFNITNNYFIDCVFDFDFSKEGYYVFDQNYFGKDENDLSKISHPHPVNNKNVNIATSPCLMYMDDTNQLGVDKTILSAIRNGSSIQLNRKCLNDLKEAEFVIFDPITGLVNGKLKGKKLYD